MQACTGGGFYSYDAFIQAAAAFPQFAATGSDNVNRRELAAFLAQVSHETTGQCLLALVLLVGLLADCRRARVGIDSAPAPPPAHALLPACSAAGGPATSNGYDWGLCWKVELCVQAGSDAACPSYCDQGTYPCADKKKYYGRGPMQLSWNYK